MQAQPDQPYTTIRQPATAELLIKKSRFIGQLYPAASFEEAQARLSEVKKQYWNATHNCSAMIIGRGGAYTRCSDDGEPQGTAGVPMLEALKGSGLTDVLAVVTRYFGGVLLGAGGLVRAYAQSVNEAVRAAKKVTLLPYSAFAIELPFKLWGKAQAAFAAEGCKIAEVDYAANVQLTLHVPAGREKKLLQTVAELSAGAVVPSELGRVFVEISL